MYAKDYLIIGQHATVTPEIPGVYDLTLTTRNAAGTGTKTQSRAITVCNANSQNGLNLGTGGASVTATGSFMEASQSKFTVEWWMNTSHTSTYCTGIGNSESTMLIKTDGNGAMSLYLADKSATSANNFVVPGEWHHYAVVFEQPVVYFYRDGVQITKKALNKSINQALTTLTIGSLLESFPYGFQTCKVGADACNSGFRIFFLQLRNRLIGRSLRACCQNDSSAFLQKFICGSETNATASTGNDRNFILQSHIEYLLGFLYGCSITER